MSQPSSAEVIEFVASYLGVPASSISGDSTLLGDLGIDGDDGDEFLAAFGTRFCVDLSEFDHSEYFGPEGFYPWAPFNVWVQCFRTGSPEAKAGVTPIMISDLMRAVAAGRWEPRKSESE